MPNHDVMKRNDVNLPLGYSTCCSCSGSCSCSSDILTTKHATYENRRVHVLSVHLVDRIIFGQHKYLMTSQICVSSQASRVMPCLVIMSHTCLMRQHTGSHTAVGIIQVATLWFKLHLRCQKHERVVSAANRYVPAASQEVDRAVCELLSLNEGMRLCIIP